MIHSLKDSIYSRLEKLFIWFMLKCFDNCLFFIRDEKDVIIDVLGTLFIVGGMMGKI